MARVLNDRPPLRNLLAVLREPARGDGAARRPATPCVWLRQSAEAALQELLREIAEEPDPNIRAGLLTELDSAIELASRPLTWDEIDDPDRNATPAKRRRRASAG